MGVSPHGPRPHLLVEERQHKGGAVSDPFTPTTPFAPTTTVPPGTGGSTAGGTDDSIDVTDTGVTYTTPVGVGNPPTECTLLIDTGSSNTWIGANTPYNPTSTSQGTGNTINVSYGFGTMSGKEYIETVTLSPTFVIQHQSIGVASSAEGFTDVDDILGLGPVGLTQGTVSNTPEVPTVTDNLYAQGTIPSDSLGIFYEPRRRRARSMASSPLVEPIIPSQYPGEINFVPLTATSPASNYWGIDQSVTYGGSTTILNRTAGIVDTGTTLLLLATDAFQSYQQATGATLDHALNSTLGGQEGQIYLITSDLGSPSGSGLDFINGFGWLQRFYSVFDTSNAQVGLATTPYTDAETN
ncbi:hypothetical protein PAXINDRAFT_9562 [Paxillus involutus ATCC 200175]|nr:hypothetical protein PAXINDRAFT_9562 [Paxillus involutus ATCC 200175]